MVEMYPLAKLTKEMIMARLHGDAQAPANAAELARQTIVAALGRTKATGEQARDMVQQICLGAFSGLILLEEKNLPQAACKMLAQTAEAAQAVHMDAGELMTWAMEGLAQAASLLTPPALMETQSLIGSSFHGAGPVFTELCRKAASKKPDA